MCKTRIKQLTLYCIIGVVLLHISPASAAGFTPPSEITVKMYLLENSGDKVQPEQTCQYGDLEFGCTASSSIGSYPFEEDIVTVLLEGEAANDRYLLDVVPREMSPSTHLPAAIQAQAVAARTFAYWNVRFDSVIPGAIDNSNAYQVFVPYTYDLFSPSEKAIIDAAVDNRYYMSNKNAYSISMYGYTVAPTAEDPIFAQYFADVPLQTNAGKPFPYFESVPDPISFHPDVDLIGHGVGMSQNGAGRWARGSSSYHCEPYPAPCEPLPSQPHTRWSVTWTGYDQILTHYYTGIQIRDAEAGNARRSATLRWLPLKITSAGQQVTKLCAGSETVQLTVWMQNNGADDWVYGSSAVLLEHSGEAVSAFVPPQALATAAVVKPGGTYTATVSLTTIPSFPVAEHDFYLDMFSYSTGHWFSDPTFQNPAWPKYKLTLPVESCTNQAYLPYIKQAPPVQ
jgi:hypothetical protein